MADPLPLSSLTDLTHACFELFSGETLFGQSSLEQTPVQERPRNVDLVQFIENSRSTVRQAASTAFRQFAE
jgi:hypothetical protein